MTILVNEDFTGYGADTPLEDLSTFDNEGLNASFDVIASDALKNNGGGIRIALANQVLGDNIYKVTVSGKTGGVTGNDRIGCCIRGIPDGATPGVTDGYYCALRGDQQYRVWKRVAGVETTLPGGSGAVSIAGFAATTYYNIELYFTATNLICVIDGTTYFDAAESSYTGIGQAGIYTQDSNARAGSFILDDLNGGASSFITLASAMNPVGHMIGR